MRVYIAGPMTGFPEYNFPAFHEAARVWRSQGHDVVNPAEMDEQLDGFNPKADAAKPHEVYMRRDLPALCGCDAVALLPGWRDSKGARNEVAVARMCGLDLYEVDQCDGRWRVIPPDAPPPETPLQEAQRLVHGDRQASYGHPIEDFTRTGRMWGAILGTDDVPPEKVALCMIAVKMSRECNRPKRDNAVDIAGYAETLHMVRERQGMAP